MVRLKIVPSQLPAKSARFADEPVRTTDTVVILDDRTTGRKLLEGLISQLDPAIKIMSFSSPLEALAQLDVVTPDLIITDYRMPAMNGIEFISAVRARKVMAAVPIVMVTVVEDRSIRQMALETGATDFLTRPIDPFESRARFRNLLTMHRGQKLLDVRAQWLENQVMMVTQEIRQREEETLFRLAKAGEFRDETTGNHIYRMAQLSMMIAERIGMSAGECHEVKMTAPLHDLGKIGIPDNVLLKPGALNGDEMAIMRTHPALGHSILLNSPSAYLQKGAEIALYHHEKFDGTGYPHNLKGEMIPLSARVVAVADVFDALLSKRPDKRAWTMEETLAYIEANSGAHFDPLCANALLENTDIAKEIMHAFRDN